MCNSQAKLCILVEKCDTTTTHSEDFRWDRHIQNENTVFSPLDATTSILFGVGKGEATNQEWPLFKSGIG